MKDVRRTRETASAELVPSRGGPRSQGHRLSDISVKFKEFDRVRCVHSLTNNRSE